jgi:membrane-bound metal-dependent hydrolase YbcI (DUF457 family)
MDTVTHGIVGSLIAKGYFSEKYGRVALFAATLGAVFPDSDVIIEAFSHDPLAVVRFHRGITHSWVALPVFAVIFASLTYRIARRLGIETPSWGILTAIYAIAIGSHIALDGMTSFGTRMWDPLSQSRVAWDFLFIIDFVFTAIVLLPQIVAWVHREPDRRRKRATWATVLFALATIGVWFLARAVGFPFHAWIAGLAIFIIVVLLFLPFVGNWGVRETRASWCRTGTYAMLAYIVACGVAHHTALARVEQYATVNHISVERIAAIPLPPSLLDWGGAIRATDGVYSSRFDLRQVDAPSFSFRADSAPDSFTALAVQLPEVRLYWGFARFPVIRTSMDDGHHVVDFFDQRFISRREPQPFTYRVVFDDDGEVIEEGWQSNGNLMRRMQKMLRPQKVASP